MFNFITTILHSAGKVVGSAIISLGLMLGGHSGPVQQVQTTSATTSVQEVNVAPTSSSTKSAENDKTKSAQVGEDKSRLTPVKTAELPDRNSVQSEHAIAGNDSVYVHDEKVEDAASVSTNTQSDLDDFVVRCQLSNDSRDTIGTGDIVSADIQLFEGHSTGLGGDYAIVWRSDGGELLGEADGKHVRFKFPDAGRYKITVEATRKANGNMKSDSCDVVVYCNDYECLSLKQKKISKLNDILDEIKHWYNTDDVLFQCSISESIIRALEYDFTLLGGTNIPSFDPTVDCASAMAPAAYQYKIERLRDSL